MVELSDDAITSICYAALDMECSTLCHIIAKIEEGYRDAIRDIVESTSHMESLVKVHNETKLTTRDIK